MISSFLFLIENSSLYIDPGSASAVFAMIIGGIVGVGMTLKMYWYKIRSKISKE